MDLTLMALVDLVEASVRFVDDRYGRAMAWAVAVVGCVVVLAIPVLIILWVVR
jgi:uncharacterized membrane protein YdbT with pleckstrin-like domain